MRWTAIAVLVVSGMACGSVTPAAAVVHREVAVGDECGAASLPGEIQSALAKDFSDWKIQQATGLSDMAHGRWAGDKKPACPGLAVGKFTGTVATEYALLLVPAHAGERGYRLVVFRRTGEQTGYAATTVEKSDKVKSGDYFIRSVAASDWFDRVNTKNFGVQAPDCIEIIDCAEAGYETDLYFWSNGKFRNEPVDD